MYCMWGGATCARAKDGGTAHIATAPLFRSNQNFFSGKKSPITKNMS